MTDTHFMADQSMIPPLPSEPDYSIPQLPQGAPRPTLGVPKFFIKQRRKINEDGAVTYQNVEMVDILTPGDPKAIPRHKVTEAIKRMYPREYQAFRDGIEMVPTGWPIDMWAGVNEQQVLVLKSLNIRTVEELASTADGNLHRIPMGKTLKNDAIAALKVKKETDSVEAMRRKDALNQQAIASLEARLAELQAKPEATGDEPSTTLDGDVVPAPARRGRPPKAT